MKRWLAIVTAVWAGWTLPVEADERQLQALTLDYPPYSFEAGGELTGIVFDITTEAFARIGVSLDTKIKPWKRALVEARVGEVDVLFNALHTPERASYLTYVDFSVIDEEVVLISRKGMDSPYQGDLADISNSSVAVPRGFSLGKRVDQAFETGLLTKVLANTSAEALRVLASGRADYVATDRYTAAHVIAQHASLSELEILSPAIEVTPTYIVFTKQRDFSDMAKRLANELEEMREEGRLQQIINRYVSGISQ